MSDWELLGLSPTADTKAIKKAYAVKLREIDQDREPARFQKLREAFENCLSYAPYQVEVDNPKSIESPFTLENAEPSRTNTEHSSSHSIEKPQRKKALTPEEKVIQAQKKIERSIIKKVKVHLKEVKLEYEKGSFNDVTTLFKTFSGQSEFQDLFAREKLEEAYLTWLHDADVDNPEILRTAIAIFHWQYHIASKGYDEYRINEILDCLEKLNPRSEFQTPRALKVEKEKKSLNWWHIFLIAMVITKLFVFLGKEGCKG